jgi:hypothetical protein
VADLMIRFKSRRRIRGRGPDPHPRAAGRSALLAGGAGVDSGSSIRSCGYAVDLVLVGDGLCAEAALRPRLHSSQCSIARKAVSELAT